MLQHVNSCEVVTVRDNKREEYKRAGKGRWVKWIGGIKMSREAAAGGR